jgi:hypothetical protein
VTEMIGDEFMNTRESRTQYEQQQGEFFSWAACQTRPSVPAPTEQEQKQQQPREQAQSAEDHDVTVDPQDGAGTGFMWRLGNEGQLAMAGALSYLSDCRCSRHGPAS